MFAAAAAIQMEEGDEVTTIIPHFDSTNYELHSLIATGSFAEVHKARDKQTNFFVAMKKEIAQGQHTITNECEILKKMRHENVVKLIAVCSDRHEGNQRSGNINLILELCDYELKKLLRTKDFEIKPAEIKHALHQIFTALHYVHSKKVIHRDIKPNNFLVNRNGILKLADFGLATTVFIATEPRPSSNYLNEMYRPPELFLGDRFYGAAIDMWAAGCVMPQFWTRKQLFKKEGEDPSLGFFKDRLYAICRLCGLITPQVWPGVENLDLYHKLIPDLGLPRSQKRAVRGIFTNVLEDEHATDLLDRLLTLDPSQRANSIEALNHAYFRSKPYPTHLMLAFQRINYTLNIEYKPLMLI